jgi:hypothetical protein
MSTPLREALRQLHEEDQYTNQIPSDGRGLLRTMREGILQGPTRAVPLHEAAHERSASVDIDRENTTRRDRITPRVQVDIGTYSLTAGAALMIPLPRWARQVIIQNNTDQSGGTSAVIYRSLDGTPATPGDFAIRQGQTTSDDVFTRWLSIYCASANTINGKTTGGIVVEVSS